MGHPATIKILLAVLAMLIGVIVGLVAGILARASGSSLPASIRDGGIAFGGTVSLTILIMTALGLL
jgi:hypothetical protein